MKRVHFLKIQKTTRFGHKLFFDESELVAGNFEVVTEAYIAVRLVLEKLKTPHIWQHTTASGASDRTGGPIVEMMDWHRTRSPETILFDEIEYRPSPCEAKQSKPRGEAIRGLGQTL